jgi:predicted 2-oxoglutarate/Fe(II)-dependent dioxygenase YbiX
MNTAINTVKPGAFTLEDVFTPTECKAVIERTEALGFATATVTIAGGTQNMPGVRNNDRVKFDDLELAGELWKRFEGVAPAHMEDWTAARLNERFAVYRYDAGQRFKRHQDGMVETDTGEQSRFTVLIYLNDDCEGGETIFSDVDRSGSQIRFLETNVKPRPGLALLFQHELWHEGAAVTTGRKYVLRTDVLYRRA